jgi:site-specific DNA-methyltransferase (adenine-specific)
MQIDTSILPQKSNLQQQEWYSQLVDELKATLTEAIFTSRFALVEGYWISGKLIREAWREHYENEDPTNVTQLLQSLAVDISRSYRTLWYALESYDTYPEMGLLPEGKNISWTKLITKYLTDPREEINIDNIKLPKEIEIKNEDFRESSLLESTVDCIITDPPYPVEFIDLWDDLGKFASRVLKPSGFLVAYSGEMNLPLVIERLGKHLNYYWTFCLKHSGINQIIHARDITCAWKPILIYQKPPFKKIGKLVTDYVVSENMEKEDHKWQQSESGVEKLIESFTNPGDLIVDPFSGAGTFAKVAHKLKRNTLAYEIDNLAYKSSIKRIYDTTRTN